MAVLVYHFTTRNSAAWGQPPSEVFPRVQGIAAFGAFGVELFFVISGFVILMTAWGRTLPQFIGSRAGRLFPAYWTGVLLTGVLLLVIWPEGSRRRLTDIIGNVSMTQGAFGIPHVDGVYWTLWAELRFYVLIAIFIAIGITARRVVVFAAVWPVVAAIAQQTGSGFIANLLISDYAPMFAGGMMLYCIYRQPRNLVYWAVLVQNATTAAVWTGGITAGAIARNTVVTPGALRSAVVVIACFILVAVAVLTPLSKISWRWLATAGALTYPLYLVHEYWGWWFITLCRDQFGAVEVLAVAAVLCLAMAWGIQRFVERPVGPRLRRGVQRSIEALGVRP